VEICRPKNLGRFDKIPRQRAVKARAIEPIFVHRSANGKPARISNYALEE